MASAESVVLGKGVNKYICHGPLSSVGSLAVLAHDLAGRDFHKVAWFARNTAFDDNGPILCVHEQHLERLFLEYLCLLFDSSQSRNIADAWTSSCRVLTRLSPMWPAIFRPGSTRLGVAEEPMEPCCRFDLDPCDIGPLAMPYFFTVPAVGASKHTPFKTGLT